MSEYKELSAEEVLEKFDKEAGSRNYQGTMGKLIMAICVLFSGFQIYTAVFGVLDAHLQRAVHLAFGLLLIYLLYPGRSSWSRTTLHPVDLILGLIATATPIYIIVFYNELVTRAGINTSTDLLVGLIGIILLIEATRRVVGWPMILVALFFITYSFLGPYMPGVLAHRGLGWEELVGHLYFTTEGVFGIPLGVSSTFIFLFILFGAYLETTGLGKFFIDLSNALAGWAAGGPAKVAVLSSGLMGTVSGSSVANVAGTGSFTIPMMKKLGYRPEFAGAVEAAASTGGQLMPPVMGAAAFLMAEFVGVPYIDVVKAATIPALLYYVGVWLGVHYEAKKHGLKGTPRELLPKFKDLLFEKGHLAIPLIVIVYLLVTGYTPMRAALVAIVLAIGASMLKKSTRITPWQIVEGLINGAKGILGVLVACATAGIIIGVVTKTGVGLKLATALLELAGGNLIPAMFFTMITSLLLGMGVPTTANYVITSTIAAPALEQMGIPILAAHMFAFYFGIVADVTPPVALAAYAGAGIAGSNPMRTGVVAAKLAIAAFIIPYVFVLSPTILMINATIPTLIMATLTALIGMWGLSISMIGFFVAPTTKLERLLYFVGGVFMIDPGGMTDLIGIAILATASFFQYKRKRKLDAQNKVG
ncbi:TRAP transporter permease [Succinispira mobilis]|uniref:TRAP transporter permease n=1 Tax=Succinispira mobilis TaxID=78120 RepID=UPI0003792045|nr:TRAP transporter permease [Succinispira mobilis]